MEVFHELTEKYHTDLENFLNESFDNGYGLDYADLPERQKVEIRHDFIVKAFKDLNSQGYQTIKGKYLKTNTLNHLLTLKKEHFKFFMECPFTSECKEIILK